MPTKIIVDLAAGTTTEVELQGEELAAYNASLAEQEAARIAAEQTAQVVEQPAQEPPAPEEQGA